MKPIFCPNEYRSAAFCATYTRLLRWLRGFSPPLIYHLNIYTSSLCVSGINSLHQTFGSGSFTIVLPFFCVIPSRTFSVYFFNCCFYLTKIKPAFCTFSYSKYVVRGLLLPATNSDEMILKIQLLNHLKKIT